MSLIGSTEAKECIVGSIHNIDILDGYSAYELAKKNGFKGTLEEWLASLKGEKGDKGDKGDKGEPGSLEFYNELDAKGKRFANVGTPVEDGDAANKKYVDEANNALKNYIYASDNELKSYVDDSLGGTLTTHRVKETGTDLNDYITLGIYFFDSDHKPANMPSGNGNGWLFVLATPNTSMKKQMWFRAGSHTTDYQTYVRTYIGGWGKWRRLVVEDDLSNYALKNTLANYALKNDLTNYATLSKLPEHYNQWEYFYVDGKGGNDDNDGTTDKKAFKTLDRAFRLLNEGRVDLRIYIITPGTYTFERSTFTAIALHIKNDSGGAVTVQRKFKNPDEEGITAFYQCHISSEGVNWHGGINSKGNYEYLYFEGCTTKLVTNKNVSSISVYPTIRTFGGFITVNNASCGGIDMKYCTGVFNNINIDVRDNMLNALKQEDSKGKVFYFGVSLNMCMTRFKGTNTMLWGGDPIESAKSKAFSVGRGFLNFAAGAVFSGKELYEYGAGGKIAGCSVFCDKDSKKHLINTWGATDDSNIWSSENPSKKKMVKEFFPNANGNVELGLADDVIIHSITAQMTGKEDNFNGSKNFLCNLFLIDKRWYANLTTVGTKVNVTTDKPVEITVTYSDA